MRVAVITDAGISSRFNAGITEDEKALKCLYTETGFKDTLLFRLMDKCSFADRIIVVGGYKYDDLASFYKDNLSADFPATDLIYNDHYSDLSSGFSLYLGIKAALEYDPDEIFFVEGDLDIDNSSFQKIVLSGRSVLSINREPVYSDKAVVLYKDGSGNYKYAFNSSHGLLKINEPFSCILNSGQVWKFTDPAKLKEANDEFSGTERNGTNLSIIQSYIDKVGADNFDIVCLERWTNCNTREDYKKILNYWRTEE
ncbi:MAG: hypothetical protein J5715_01755 [Clostridiales bacterium]|nr:hypothetical protein [Clostridiales bacterium]